jgi:hypothetical protein
MKNYNVYFIISKTILILLTLSYTNCLNSQSTNIKQHLNTTHEIEIKILSNKIIPKDKNISDITIEIDKNKNIKVFCKNYCNYNGYCIDGKCICKPGYTGNDCSLSISTECPNNCNGNGQCNILQNKCVCDKDWTGLDCSYSNKYNINNI